jgi:hypothetical protein
VRKAAKIALVCLLIFIGTISFTLVFAAVLTPRNESSGVPDSHAKDSVLPKVQGVTKNNGFYNISLAFINVTYAENLDNILINPNNSKAITGLVAYMNGTALDEGAPVACKLKSGDSMQINLTLPISEFASGETVNLCVMGDCFGCGIPIVLPLRNLPLFVTFNIMLCYSASSPNKPLSLSWFDSGLGWSLGLTQSQNS